MLFRSPGTNVCSLGSLSLQKVFCGHEHTLSNLEFAQKVEPCNEHVQAKLSWAQVHPSIASWVGEGEGGGPWVPPTPNQERKDRERIMGRGDWEEGSEEDIM